MPHPHPPRPGFRNPGNLCYLNATLHLLLSDRTLFSILSQRTRNVSQPSRLPLTSSLLSLLAPHPPSLPTAFRTALTYHAPEFDSPDMQDAHEFLNAVLNALTDEYSRRRLQCRRLHLSLGYTLRQASILRCRHCDDTSDPRVEKSFGISLPIPARYHHCQNQREENVESANLQALLEDTFEPETVERLCPHCSYPSATKVTYVSRAPRALVVQIGRFANDMTKICAEVKVPKKLFLPVCSVDRGPESVHVYKLVSTVLHLSDSLDDGHYVALVRGCQGSVLGYDDERMHEVKSPERHRDKNAYVCLYLKTRVLMSDPRESEGEHLFL